MGIHSRGILRRLPTPARSEMMGPAPMTDAAAPPVPAQVASSPAALRWLTSKDPDRLVLKRSVRAAIVVPSVFAIAHAFFSNPQVALFAAFGSFSLLLLVEFTGRARSRLTSYGLLVAIGAGFIALGTAVSTHKVAAVIAMGAVGFAVLFAGIVAPQAATSSTAALLVFVLPVAVAQPTSAISARLVGWMLASAASTAACLLLWPPPWHDNLRIRLSATVSALARLCAALSRGEAGYQQQAMVASELGRLRGQFTATPYPPTGAASVAVALSKLVGRVEWVVGNTARIGGGLFAGDDPLATERTGARAVVESVADTLHGTARLICDGDGHPVDDQARIMEVQEATRRLDKLMEEQLGADVATVVVASSEADDVIVGARPSGEDNADSIAGSSLGPGFHARSLGIATEMVADAALEATGAEAAVGTSLGMAEASRREFGHRLVSHLSLRSVWFRNAFRGSVGLALAVVVVEITNVQHGFWVVLGTLSVLRSNALGTGATALRAVWGTAIGFVVGSALMIGISYHTVLLWVLLPIAVLVAGLAPSMISFVAGQAAFTVVVIILFNVIAPDGWKVGLTRIEDVAIGCGVSIVVGLLFWPRGATAALGRALSDSFVANSAYLADAVERLTTTSRRIDTESSQRASRRAYLLLDDAYRQFFTERGAKVIPVETIARLFTGSNRLRLAAFTLATLEVEPPAAGLPEVDGITIAEAVLRDSYAASHRWYEEFADLLAGRRAAADPPPPHGQVLHEVLRTAFEQVRAQQRPDRVHTALQMLWADELLENQSQLQADLLASADSFVRRRSFLI